MNNSLSNRVAIYARVSTQEQAEQGYSIEAQVKILNEYCRQTNKVLFDEYIDPGISGKEVGNRPRLKQLLLDAKAGLFDEVVVWKINRLSRNQSDLMNLVDELNKHNVIFRSYSENFETETPMGRFALQMMGSVAELERNTIVENVRMGMRARASAGLWNGGNVFGYRSKYNDELKANKLEIVEEEAIIVQEIFRLFANEKWGYIRIANQLNKRGLRTRENNYWGKQSVKQIIDNKLYFGKIQWGLHSDWSKKRRKGKQENPIISDGKHDAIIDEETWEKAQKIREVRGKVSEKVYEGNYILSGLLKCPVCGSSMISHRTIKKGKLGERVIYRYYKCLNSVSRGSEACKSNLINADRAEEQVLSRINEIVKSKEIIESIINRMEKESYIDTTPLENKLIEHKNEIKKIEAGRKENLKFRYENSIDIRTLDEMFKYFDQMEIENNNIIDSIQKELNNIHNQVKVEPEKVRAILENFTKIFEKADIAKKKMLLKSVIERVSVTQGENGVRKVENIKLYFSPEDIEFIGSKKFVNANGAVNHIISENRNFTFRHSNLLSERM